MTLRIAAIYMIALGILGLCWPFLGSHINYPEAQAPSLICSIKLFARELCLALGFIIGGIGVIKKQMWSRKVCLTVLALAFFYGGNVLGWQWAEGKPSTPILMAAYGVSFILFGICFLFLFQHLTEHNLKHSDKSEHSE